MSMLPSFLTIKCGVSKTKSKVGIEYDINKLVKKYKLTGSFPNLQMNDNKFSDGVIDLTSVGDYQDCCDRVAKANEIFQSYPAVIRRRFGDDIGNFLNFLEEAKTDKQKVAEAITLGILTVKDQDVPVVKPTPKPIDATAIKIDATAIKKEG